MDDGAAYDTPLDESYRIRGEALMKAAKFLIQNPAISFVRLQKLFTGKESKGGRFEQYFIIERVGSAKNEKTGKVEEIFKYQWLEINGNKQKLDDVSLGTLNEIFVLIGIYKETLLNIFAG